MTGADLAHFPSGSWGLETKNNSVGFWGVLFLVALAEQTWGTPRLFGAGTRAMEDRKRQQAACRKLQTWVRGQGNPKIGVPTFAGGEGPFNPLKGEAFFFFFGGCSSCAFFFFFFLHIRFDTHPIGRAEK